MKSTRRFALFTAFVVLLPVAWLNQPASAAAPGNPPFLSSLPAGSIGEYIDAIHDAGNAALASVMTFKHPDPNSQDTVACTTPFGSSTCPTFSTPYFSGGYPSESYVNYHFGLCLTDLQVSCIQSVSINGSALTFDKYIGNASVPVDSSVLPNWIPSNISIWKDNSGNEYAINVFSLEPHEYSTSYEAEINRVIDDANPLYSAITEKNLYFQRSFVQCAYIEVGHCGKKVDFLPNSDISLAIRLTSRTDLGHGSSLSRVAFSTLADPSASSIGGAERTSDTISGKPMSIPTYYRVLSGDAAKQATAKPNGGWSQVANYEGDLRFPWSKIDGPSTWFVKVVSSNNCSGQQGIVEISSSDSLEGGYLSNILEPVLASGARSSIHAQIAMTNAFAACTFASAGADWSKQVRIWATSSIYSYPLLNVIKTQDSKWVTYSADLPSNAWNEKFPDSKSIDLILPKDHMKLGDGDFVTSTTQPPAVLGKLKVGSLLRVVPGKYLNLYPIKIKGYQWESCSKSLAQDSYGFSCEIIAKATKNTYTLKKSDVGHFIVARELWVLPDKYSLSGVGSSSYRTRKVTK